MTSHREVAAGVFLTAYGDGSYTVCNYNRSPATFDGNAIPALGYVLFNPDGTRKAFAFDPENGLCEK